MLVMEAAPLDRDSSAVAVRWFSGVPSRPIALGPVSSVAVDGATASGQGTFCGAPQSTLSVTLLRVDTRQDRVLGITRFDELEPQVTVSSRKLCLAIPRRVRGALALFVLTMYLVGGVLHGLYDLDVTNASGEAVISLVDKGVGHSEKGVVAGHHCHGCFSVSVPAPTIGAMKLMPAVEVMAALDVGHRGLPPGIDPPPPKFLT